MNRRSSRIKRAIVSQPKDKQPTVEQSESLNNSCPDERGSSVGRINEVVRPALPASKQRLQGTAEHQLPKIDPPLIKIWCVVRLNDKKPSTDQLAAELDVSLNPNKDKLIDPDTSQPVPKKRRGRPKKFSTRRSNVCKVLPPQISSPKLEHPPDDTSTPKRPSSNELVGIETDTKRMPPKLRLVRRKLSLPVQITPTTTSQPQETHTVSKEKVAVIGDSNTGELPNVEEPSGPKKPTTEVEADSKSGVVEFVSIKVSAKNCTTAEEKEPVAVKNLCVEETPVDDPDPIELPLVEEPSMEDCHSSLNKNVCCKTKRSKDTKEGYSKTKDDNQSSGTSGLSVHMPGLRWSIAEKRKLVTEARQWGIRPTARRHNMSSSTLSSWMIEDFSGDLTKPRNKKRLNGRRSSRYDKTGEVALKDWVIQKMVKKERVSYKELWTKAMELIVPCNPDFRANLGWIRSFLHRQQLNLRNMIHTPSKKQRVPISTRKS